MQFSNLNTKGCRNQNIQSTNAAAAADVRFAQKKESRCRDKIALQKCSRKAKNTSSSASASSSSSPSASSIFSSSYL
jgi:hypothetical protein